MLEEKVNLIKLMSRSDDPSAANQARINETEVHISRLKKVLQNLSELK